jgi:hypothetical protein
VQASQQLGCFPTHEVPFFGAVQAALLLFVTHFVTPAEFVRQQVTKPDLPQVDLAAHLTIAP